MQSRYFIRNLNLQLLKSFLNDIEHHQLRIGQSLMNIGVQTVNTFGQFRLNQKTSTIRTLSFSKDTIEL